MTDFQLETPIYTHAEQMAWGSQWFWKGVVFGVSLCGLTVSVACLVAYLVGAKP